MLFRKTALIALLILVLMLLGGVVWMWSSQARLYSDPNAPRTNDSYLRAHALAEKLPPVPTNFFSSVVVDQSSSNQIQIWSPGSFQTPDIDYEPLKVLEVDSSQTANLGAGSIRLACIGVAHSLIRTNIDWSTSIPATYYMPDLHPATAEETAGIVPHYDRKLQFYGDFPSASFYFVCSNLSGFKTLNFTAFDARTHHPLTQGYSSSYLSNVFWFSPTVRLWHQTPVELIVTVATGPAQTFTIAPRSGAEIQYPGGVIRVLAVTDLELGGTSSRSDGRTNHVTMRVETGPRFDRGRPRSTFLFYSWPNARLRGEIEHYGHDGKKLQTYGGGTSGHLINSRIVAEVEEVKEIRFQYYPNIYRLVFKIPELPGLPEQNRNLENLFDVYVPSMHFQYEHHFQDNIPQLVQMSYASLPLTFSNAFFPIIRTNTTARALFQELGSMLANREDQLVADPEKNKIEARPHPLYALVQKFKKKLGLTP